MKAKVKIIVKLSKSQFQYLPLDTFWVNFVAVTIHLREPLQIMFIS